MQSSRACSDLAAALGNTLLHQGLTVAVAESCTGGMIGSSLTSIPGCSAWFKGGIIAYSDRVKRALLGVSEEILAAHGAVSGETVQAMALGAALRLESDCALSVSGIAGPGGGTPEKPVGLVWTGVCRGTEIRVARHVFSGDRREVRGLAAGAALRELLALLGG